MKKSELLHCPFCGLQVSRFLYAFADELSYQCGSCNHGYKVERNKVIEERDGYYEELELLPLGDVREMPLPGFLEVRREAS